MLDDTASYPNPASLQDAELIRASAQMLVDACHGAALAAGWYTDLKTGLPKELNIGERLMLAVSELAEAMEGHRKKLQDDKLPQHPMFTVELADALIRIFDLAGYAAPALPIAFVEKLLFNAQRPDHKPEARQAAGGKAY